MLNLVHVAYTQCDQLGPLAAADVIAAPACFALCCLLLAPTVRMRNVLKEMTHTQRCTAAWPIGQCAKSSTLATLTLPSSPRCSAAPNVR